MQSWVAQATKSTAIVQQIKQDLDQFRGELRFNVATTEDYGWLTKLTVYSIENKVREILDSVESAKRNTAATHAAANEVQEKLSKKLLTDQEADQLRAKAANLQKQNKELRRKKAKPICKLFLNRGKADH